MHMYQKLRVSIGKVPGRYARIQQMHLLLAKVQTAKEKTAKFGLSCNTRITRPFVTGNV